MSTGDKRQMIFNQYKDNLNMLVNEKMIESEKDVYVCPLCLKAHKDLNNDDPLTLEDAPPNSLGGHANTLTCQSCNNTAGHEIDFHLVERLRELDSANFLAGTKTKVRVKIGENTFQGMITVDNDGTLHMFHSLKNNHPLKLKAEMSGVENGMIINMDFIKSRVIPEKLGYALLKSAYILAFQKLGYSILLDECFDIVRTQLKNPNEKIYPEGFWFPNPYPKKMAGVYFVMDKGFECLLVFFNLNTGISERMFGVLLPLPINKLQSVIALVNQRFEEHGYLALTLYPIEQDNYITNIESVKALNKWITVRQND